MNTTRKQFWMKVGIATAAVHVLFCVQAFLPLQRGGMVSEGPWLSIFYPHYMLIYFLPPAYPINYSGSVVEVSYVDFCGKMLVAIPASLIYGLLLAGIGSVFTRFWKVR